MKIRRQYYLVGRAVSAIIMTIYAMRGMFQKNPSKVSFTEKDIFPEIEDIDREEEATERVTVELEDEDKKKNLPKGAKGLLLYRNASMMKEQKEKRPAADHLNAHFHFPKKKTATQLSLHQLSRKKGLLLCVLSSSSSCTIPKFLGLPTLSRLLLACTNFSGQPLKIGEKISSERNGCKTAVYLCTCTCVVAPDVLQTRDEANVKDVEGTKVVARLLSR